MKSLITTDFLDVTLTQPLTDAAAGEIQVTVKNPLATALRHVSVRLREAGRHATPRRRVAIVPPFEEDAYVIAEIVPDKKAARLFCVRPVEAEVGKTVELELVVGFHQAASYESHIARDSPQAHGKTAGDDQSVRFEVRIEARPEVYVAIGAVETLRQSLADLYDNLQQVGRETHRKLDSALPNTSVEAARVGLSESTFKLLADVVDIGARLVSTQSRKSKREREGGSS